jgi:hypothetical protein
MEQKSHIQVSPEQLQAIGNGFLAYVKPIEPEAASALIGQTVTAPPGTKFFALYNANGAPISVSQTYEAAIGNAMEHELVPASVH